MARSLIAGVGLLLAFCFYYTATLITSRRHSREAARLGCQPPLRRPHKLPWGIDFAYLLLEADRQKRAPDYFIELYESLGRPSTWLQLLAGSDNIMTVDPKNLQALLATQFKDFGLGPTRRGNFVAMLGDGIFTLDGKPWYGLAIEDGSVLTNP